jgi:hypothetical protein
MFEQNIALVVRHADELDCNFACLASTADFASMRVMMEEDIFRGIKRNEPSARTALFHELGHYYYKHLQTGIAGTDDYDMRRWQAVNQGTVICQELEADKFAAAYLGVAYVIEGLCALTEEAEHRYENEPDESEEATIAIKELQMRIASLRKLHEGEPLSLDGGGIMGATTNRNFGSDRMGCARGGK